MKRGQMKMSFGMIFSIILIIAFIAFAFYAIQKFLDFRDTAQIGKFKDSLQKDINEIWKSSKASQPVEYFLPKKIQAVCFRDNDYENLVFLSDEYIPGYALKHIDLDKTIVTGNELCITNINGKVKMTLKKDFDELLVTITG